MISNLNIGLFDKVMDEILREPDDKAIKDVAWEQRWWGYANPAKGEAVKVTDDLYADGTTYQGFTLPIDCQTAGCAAGHITYFTGYLPVVDQGSLNIDGRASYSHAFKDGKVSLVVDAACRELGVDYDDLGVDGVHLFDPHNSAERMQTLAADIRERYYATQSV